jgi:hypothetical protein
VIVIGMDDIRIHVGHGAHITLNNVLYIPTATVRLISVQCLTRDSSVTVHFNNLDCWFTNSTGNTVIHGCLSNEKLYSLSLHSLTATHAYVVHSAPDIAMWHCGLGYANYQAVLDMINSSLIRLHHSN